VRSTRKNPEILGYRRPNGAVGIRNHVAIVYTTNCSKVVARSLHDRFPAGTQLFGYPEGCSFRDAPVAKLVAMAQHASYAAVLVVGLGCEGTNAHELAARIAESGQTVEAVAIQFDGGDLKTAEKGSRILVTLLQHASVVPRELLPISELVVGAECGGSDATSGLVANPLVGKVADRLIDQGGTYMHTEPHELMGCGDVLAARAVDEGVARDVRAAIEEAERESFESGAFQIGFGNIEGGLTTIEEKSYGCLAKSGSRPLQGVLRSYGRPPGKGYYLQVAPTASQTYYGDSEDVSQFAACGAHLAFFKTGCRLRRDPDHARRANHRRDGRRALRGDDRRRRGEVDEVRDSSPLRGVADANAFGDLTSFRGSRSRSRPPREASAPARGRRTLPCAPSSSRCRAGGTDSRTGTPNGTRSARS
jgi:altronate dehydratase large subunit